MSRWPRLSIAGTTDVVTVADFFYQNSPSNTWNPVQEVRFEDGEVWNLAEIQNQLTMQIPKLQASESTQPSGADKYAVSAFQDGAQQPEFPSNDAMPASHKPLALDGLIAPLKPYPFAASSMAMDAVALYVGADKSLSDASLDSQMHQLLSAMAGFAPAPAGQTAMANGAYDQHLLAPVVASSLA